MTKYQFLFEWQRCSDGYAIYDSKGKEICEHPVVDDEESWGRLMVPRSNRMETFSPFDRHAAIQRVLQDKKNTHGYLDFAKIYGLLSHPTEPESISTFYLVASELRTMFRYYDSGNISRLEKLYNESRWGKNSLRFEITDSGSVFVSHNPFTLRDALWVEFGEMVARGENHQVCAECGVWYMPDRQRRSNSKNVFCSASHSKNFHNRKFKELKEEKKIVLSDG